MQVTVEEKHQLKINIFQNYEHLYLYHTSPDKAFIGTFVNRGNLPYFHVETLEITLTVPLREKIVNFISCPANLYNWETNKIKFFTYESFLMTEFDHEKLARLYRGQNNLIQIFHWKPRPCQLFNFILKLHLVE